MKIDKTVTLIISPVGTWPTGGELTMTVLVHLGACVAFVMRELNT